MTEPILKRHGAHAMGLISGESDGRFRASLSVRTMELAQEQRRGPELFASASAAADWLRGQAARHGFVPEDFDIVVEPYRE